MEDCKVDFHRWQKSTASAQGNCVEVAIEAREVLVRDSKAPDGPVLSFSPRAWSTFIERVKAAEQAN